MKGKVLRTVWVRVVRVSLRVGWVDARVAARNSTLKNTQFVKLRCVS